MTHDIFSLQKNDPHFDELCLKVFNYQAEENAVYSLFLNHLGVDVSSITRVSDIPYLPISLFKTHRVVAGSAAAEIVFTSSGTTGMQTSRHEVLDLNIYRESFRRSFELHYGDPSEICILALLPSYLEREGSSLIYMVDDLIEKSQHQGSGYFLYGHDELSEKLLRLRDEGRKVLLLGVSYALLDYAEYLEAAGSGSNSGVAVKLQLALADFPELIVMETGGMKGRRREMIRAELHQMLMKTYQRSAIHSEYGMTELLSQAYSKGDGIFTCPPWMKVSLRDTNDPFSGVREGQSGGINVIDLANLYSCSFIATQDLGRMHDDHRFEVMGRFDHSDVRGCNLLIG